MEALDNSSAVTEGNPLLPETGKEFENMLQLVMYKPHPFICHKKMMNALAKVQSRHYEYFRESKRMTARGGEGEEEGEGV